MTHGAPINILDYGAVSGTDCTAALQAAINATVAGKKSLYVPAGIYEYTTLAINGEFRVYGDGNSSILRTTQTFNGGITITTRWPVIFENISLTAAGPQTAGALLTVTDNTFENGLSTFRNVTFANYYVGLRFLRAATWSVTDCYFESAGVDAGSTSLWIENTAYPDSGDSSVIGNVFYYSNNIGTHIRQLSSGGTKITSNKFLFGEVHYRMVLPAAVNTYDLLFVSNSSEFAEVANMVFDATSGSTFANVLINSNEYTVTSGKTGILVNDSGSAWLSGVCIGQNVFGSTGAATAMALNNCRQSVVDTNLYRMETGSTGIFIGANTLGIDVKPQSFSNGVQTAVTGSVAAQYVSVVTSTGVNFALSVGASIDIDLGYSIDVGVALITVGGNVNTVGDVTGLYIATGTGTITTIDAIANVAVTTNGTKITIQNNTGQSFSGKALVTY